ncbi:MAG TPA: caspase family protein [Blastocatellia bacterium]|nr:caspase family protein [Blastocatellia bacterium]
MHSPVSTIVLLSALLVGSAFPVSVLQTEIDRKLTMQAPPPIVALPAKANRWALIIGVDRYRDAQISGLKGAGNDAQMLARSIVQYAGFPQDQVILLSSDQPEERQPTRVNILRRLSNLASIVPQDGLLLVSFAGHGIERGGQAFLLPSDAQVSEDVSFLEDTAVSVSRMRDRIKATGVKQVLLVLDACRNDPAGRADAPNLLTEGYVRGFNFDLRNREVNAFAVLYATEVGKRAFEYTEKKQGYFTWALVEGMKGAAANEKGEVTLARLVEYVQDTVAKRTQIDLGPGKVQRPFANIQGYKANELVVAVSAKGAAAFVEEAKLPDPAAMELRFWDAIANSSNPADFRDYLDKYPDGQFAGVARRRVEGLDAAHRTAAEPPREKAAKPANVFSLRHAHQSFTKLGIASATMTISTSGIHYSEIGEDVKTGHNFTSSCTDFKEAKFENFRNAREVKDIQRFALQDPVKLTIRSAQSLDQAFAERREAEAMLIAIRDVCGIKASTTPSSKGWTLKP